MTTTKEVHKGEADRTIQGNVSVTHHLAFALSNLNSKSLNITCFGGFYQKLLKSCIIVKPWPQTLNPKPLSPKPKPKLISMKDESHNKTQRVREVQNGLPYLSGKNISGGQQEQGHGVLHHVQGQHHHQHLSFFQF